jgi:hypothetical protein
MIRVMTVHDVNWYENAYDFVDTDGTPFLAVVSHGECEGELADGHAHIEVGVEDMTWGATEIDVNRDGVDDVLWRGTIRYDDHEITQYRVYTILDGARVELARIEDDRGYGVLTEVHAEDLSWADVDPKTWIAVERTRFRTRMVTGEVWIWDGDELVERTDLRRRYPIEVGH